MRILLIIPVINISDHFFKMIDYFNSLKDTDFIFVDYGSNDNTKYLLKNNNINHLTTIYKSTRKNALMLGIEYAYWNNYDYCLEWQSNIQVSKKTYTSLIKQIRTENTDIVLGKRFHLSNKEEMKKYKLSKHLRRTIRSLTGNVITDPTLGIRAINRPIMKKLVDDIEWTLSAETISHLIEAGFSYNETLLLVELLYNIKEKWVKKQWMRILIFLSLIFVQPFRSKGK